MNRNKFGSLVFLFIALTWSISAAAVQIDVDTGSYEGRWEIAGITTLFTGNRTVSLDPGRYLVRLARHSGAQFDIEVSAIGTVSSINSDAAIAVGNVLTFNTTTISVDPAAYQKTFEVRGVTALLNAPATVTVVPGLNFQVQLARYLGSLIPIDMLMNGDHSKFPCLRRDKTAGDNHED